MPFLDWVNKNQAKQVAGEVPYRLLDFQEQHGDAGTGDNLLIQGDNLEALKALIPFYAGRVKCIFIDPPYNTQSAFEHYDDKLEHSQWLSMMYPRLVLLRDLLSNDGSLWITIDDNESHYLKILCDEIFGRDNFVANLAWHKRVSPANDAKYFSGDFDHIFVIAKNKTSWTPNRLKHSEDQLTYYKNPDNDPRGPWNSGAYTCAKSADERPNLYYAITNPFNGEEIWPSRTRVWAYDIKGHQKNVAENLIYWGKDGNAKMPRIKKFLSTARPVVPRSIWFHGEAGHNQESKIEIEALFRPAPFATPKPERLIKRVLEVATSPMDIVLDSFLGSATTSAVAHKMGRRYIGIEMGDHARTHCIPRLQKVIEGEQGGISEAVNWKGGGGFRFYTLGDPVFLADGGINPQVRFRALAGYIWHFETGQPAARDFKSPVLGEHEVTTYCLLYNGILGDKRPQGGNVLTQAVLDELDRLAGKKRRPGEGKRIIYGEKTLLSQRRLEAENIVFKQIPYDIKAR